MTALLLALIAREHGRLNDVWQHHGAALRKRVREIAGDGEAIDASAFEREMEGLADALVNEDAYAEAVNAGRKTFPDAHRDNDDPVIAKWTDRVQPYADAVPGRLAAELADIVNAAKAAADATTSSVIESADAKISAQTPDVTRYAEPMWGAGWNGYGEQLADAGVMLIWLLDPSSQSCEGCIEFADGSPYASDDMPSYPGEGDTECLDRCRCAVVADRDTWYEVMEPGG